MKDISNRAMELAKDTKKKYIDIEIADWQQSLNETKSKIKELEKQARNELAKLQLWQTAKIYRKEIESSKFIPKVIRQ